MRKQKEPGSVIHWRQPRGRALAGVCERFGSTQRLPIGKGRVGPPAKLNADGSDAEPEGCPVPQECNSPLPPHMHAPRPNPAATLASRRGSALTPTNYPQQRTRDRFGVAHARLSTRTVTCAQPEEPDSSVPPVPHETAAVPVCSPLHGEERTR